MAEVSREEFDALAARITEVENRQDAHAVVIAAALQRVEGRLTRVEDTLVELVTLTRAIARRVGLNDA
jgi:hypothetical protein